MLTLVTGTGCSLGALIAATTSASRADPFIAAATASAAFTLAGQRALATARGPGQLSTNILDEIFLLEVSTFSSTISHKIKKRRFKPRNTHPVPVAVFLRRPI
jgi:hydroxyethylthiazole kinase